MRVGVKGQYWPKRPLVLEAFREITVRRKSSVLWNSDRAHRARMSITTLDRYFFHIREGNDLMLDDVGQICPTVQAAETEAAVTGTSLLRDNAAKGIYETVCIDVTNRAGEPLVSVKVSMQVQRGV